MLKKIIEIQTINIQIISIIRKNLGEINWTTFLENLHSY